MTDHDWYLCGHCHVPFTRFAKRGPFPKFCSTGCRMKAYRRRRFDAATKRMSLDCGASSG